jgi:hypothetical protein
LVDFDKNIEEGVNTDGPTLQEYKVSLDNEKKIAMEEFKKQCTDKKSKGL